jgi:ABC-type sugar transport system permease subunit
MTLSAQELEQTYRRVYRRLTTAIWVTCAVVMSLTPLVVLIGSVAAFCVSKGIH